MFKSIKPGKGSKGGRPEIILEEHQIRWAMAFSSSNTTAAPMLGVAYDTYKKWATHYIDNDTGKTLFDLHYPGHSGNGKGHKKCKIPLDDVLNGKHLTYPDYRLKNRLLHEGLKEFECETCGFDEQRVTDGKIPLLLDYVDGNRDNKQFENLQILCLNCYFLTSGTPNNMRKADFE